MNVCKQAENLCSIANKVVLTVLLGWRSKRETGQNAFVAWRKCSSRIPLVLLIQLKSLRIWSHDLDEVN